MDINILRSLVTAGGFICFLAIVVWAYSKHAKKGFDEAAMLPFREGDDEAAQPTSMTDSKKEERES
ncbi:MAG: CcoQ/FixQ family Cbb3-type cytochrome c oxidase assembly chaperone [Candidatus Dactylopiibacterium sp.]|nr:CcoQ/FixQ family Cbb3-type cytochrome c oxidase assembly chaperone [Candidatus Dactylopiibacterium sp.]